jgi:hypothetical protein
MHQSEPIPDPLVSGNSEKRLLGAVENGECAHGTGKVRSEDIDGLLDILSLRITDELVLLYTLFPQYLVSGSRRRHVLMGGDVVPYVPSRRRIYSC